MTEFVLILLGLAVIVLSISNVLLRKSMKKDAAVAIDLLAEKHLQHFELAKQYEALEEGADEQQESFEQEYLSWDEQKEELLSVLHDLNQELNEMSPIVEYHNANCLPVMGMHPLNFG